MEITCGEAPYLVSRYDVTKETKLINPSYRTGLLDRKIRVINACASNKQYKLSYDEWHALIKQAYQSIYGFEYQGDSLFLARCNLLLTYIDYYQEYFQCNFDLSKEDNKNKLLEIADIICWNLWQMDGITNTTPVKENKNTKADKHPLGNNNLQLEFDFNNTDNNSQATTKIKNNECLIFDWQANKPISFQALLNQINN